MPNFAAVKFGFYVIDSCGLFRCHGECCLVFLGARILFVSRVSMHLANSFLIISALLRVENGFTTSFINFFHKTPDTITCHYLPEFVLLFSNTFTKYAGVQDVNGSVTARPVSADKRYRSRFVSINPYSPVPISILCLKEHRDNVLVRGQGGWEGYIYRWT